MVKALVHESRYMRAENKTPSDRPNMTESEPKVTIITACRNSGDTIGNTIQSIVDQDYLNIEHIIVDANSDDGTAEIIASYGESISLWIREPDDGIADAWNKGIKKANGEIIGILNADDFYNPGTIRAMVDAFNRNTEYGFAFGDLKMMDRSSGRSYRVFGRPEYESNTRYHMLGMPHPAVFVKKWVYDRVGLFDTKYRICADYELMRRTIVQGVKGVYVPRTLTIMSEGGVAERERMLLLREVREISVKYGASKTVAGFSFWAKCLRFHVGKAIAFVGPSLSTQRRVLHGGSWFFRGPNR
jgi:glycosyltransferase involved in cell wall biosynthesis